MAIADLAGGAWPRRAREAACLLSGEGHDSTSINVEVLADLSKAFGDEPEVRTVDLIARLIADPERPWVEWKDRKPLTPKHLADLLRPFGITSETVHIAGLKDAMGYKRVRFAEAWEAYLPGQIPIGGQISPSEVPKYPNADMTGISGDFRSTLKGSQGTSEKDDLSHSHAGLGTWVAEMGKESCESEFDHADADAADGADDVGNTGSHDFGLAQNEPESTVNGAPSHVEQLPSPALSDKFPIPDDGSIPVWLHRDSIPEPRCDDSKWAGTYADFIASGGFK